MKDKKQYDLEGRTYKFAKQVFEYLNNSPSTITNNEIKNN